MKIEWLPVLGTTSDVIEEHRRYTASLGYPLHTTRQATKDRLAVVGSGPSVANHLSELREWDGDIWAINGAASWMLDQGIDVTLFTMCQIPDWSNVSPTAFRKVRRAIVASTSPPDLFKMLPADADIVVVNVGQGGVSTGSSTVTVAPIAALGMGYKELSFFGCECCFGAKSHVDRDEIIKNKMVITCNGDMFLTNPQMLMQSLELGKMMRTFPNILKNRSGGLLEARIADPEYDVVHMSPELEAGINFKSAAA